MLCIWERIYQRYQKKNVGTALTLIQISDWWRMKRVSELFLLSNRPKYNLQYSIKLKLAKKKLKTQAHFTKHGLTIGRLSKKRSE